MINSTVNGFKFLRKQVWWWRDPAYSNKASNIQVPKGENTIRHDRPVIILQDETTCDQNSILVIPCSSSLKNKYDLIITDPEIQKSYSVTYLRTDKIMAVDSSQLIKYMFTLNDETMRRLERKVAMLLLPNLNYDWYKNDKIYTDKNNIRHIKSTILSSVKLNKNDIIEEISNSKWNSKKIKQFLNDYINIPLWEVSEKYDINESYCARLFRNWRNFSDNPEVLNYNKSLKWNSEKKIELIKFYYEFGVKKCAEEYGLNKNTIRSYVSKFKERHPKLEEIEEVGITKLPFPDQDNAANNILWFSNIVAKTCKAYDFYHSIYLNYKSKSVTNTIPPEGFYSILRNCISTGIMNLLHIIKLEDDNLYCPEILKSDKYIDTWKFLDICNNEIIPHTSSKADCLMKECRKLYGNNIALHIDVISEIKRLLGNEINYIAPAGLKLFENTMRNLFCDPDEVKKLYVK